jgi:hypothetical protein
MASRVLRVLLAAAAVILLLEGALRLFGDRLDEPLDWYHETAQQLVEEMQRWEKAGLTSDVVFAGTSMIRADVRIPIIEAELASVYRAGNLGLPAAQVPVVRRWLLEQVVPRLQPTRVVWGVQSLDFNGGRLIPTIERYEEARAVRRGFLGTIDRALSSVSALAHYRVQLRDPSFVADLFHPAKDSPEPSLEDLLSPANDSPGSNKTRRELHRIREEVLNGFTIGEAEAADFEYTVRALQDQGIEVVIVLMPVPPQYIEAHPNGHDDFRSFRQWMMTEADRLGIPLLDYSRAMPGDKFRDYTHLGLDGSIEFSRMLASDLRTLGW